MEHLSLQFGELDESIREYAFVRLLESVHAEGFIEIHRLKSAVPYFPHSYGLTPAAR
jgi:hypothetical protein